MAHSQTITHERWLFKQRQQQQQRSPAGSEWRDHDGQAPMRKVDQCITFLDCPPFTMCTCARGGACSTRMGTDRSWAK